MKHPRRVIAIAAACTVLSSGSLVARAGADGATVTRGSFHTFAAGVTRGYDISGHAQMVRSADGSTMVTIHVEGLHPDVTYGSHVHAAACSVGAADGHYMFPTSVEGGAATAHNEIWPGPVTANAGGVANGNTRVGATAAAGAVSVVVHDANGDKIACADLH